MKRRILGKTGEKLSMVGFGGIIVKDETPADAADIVARAIDRSINYFDVAPTYGNAEERLGPALKSYRQDVFLACKTTKRDAQGAEKELHQSLKHLQTDHLDLYQLHSVTTLEDVDQILSPGGALETFIKARSQGLVRYLGFSAHSEQAAIALMEHYSFDTILFPFNWTCWYKGGFGPRVLAKAHELGMGILALKSLAKRAWNEGESRKWNKAWYAPVDTFAEADLALRFTLSKPITAAVSPGHQEFLWWACDIAESFTPLQPEEVELLQVKSQELQPIFTV
jgi:aryl-alcohol dehydrogenase-like predicted oxidoreductase